MNAISNRGILVRGAIEADMGIIQAIYAHHVLNGLATFEEVPPSVEQMLARRTSVLEAGLPYLAAEIEGKIVGYSYTTAYRPRPAYRYTIEDDRSNSGSIALHRRLGFELTGTLRSVGFKLGQWVDTVLMQRALGAGDTSFPNGYMRSEP